MRLLRLVLSLATSLTALVLIFFMLLGPTQDQSPSDTQPTDSGEIRALFSFTSPGSLFPPSAIISLTDDNSTFFLARPAAFGPDLPKHGLSGPLWTGVGFGEEINDGGERGCGDDPDWSDDGDNAQEDQASPDMMGKVALLKRGGCGFLAKVLWAQRRGATAVIVGDNVRGGALIRMYARADTSNVSIPSLFTSHTTAHLLSSLMPPSDSLGDSDEEYGLYPSTVPPGSTDHAASSTLMAVLPESTQGYGQQGYLTPATGILQSKDMVPGWLRPLLSSLGMKSAQEHQSVKKAYDLSKAESTINDSRNGRKRSITSITGTDFELEASALESNAHDGLWVTLTPTDVSASPFFDTLLVLVVSPLVTLTVVYALLLLRSRIRRRRWRAPKSVVERLPVRTYQTISDVSPSATPDASSPTTPLLQRTSVQDTPTASRSEPLSQSNAPVGSSTVEQESRDREEEKRESGLAAWRRRYGGRQKECVVCLEEYVDGVSRVMSLPCGHEFHADCITPWLVTRRRTCPICKGDVVRSLSQSYHDRFQSPSPPHPARFLDNEDDLQIEVAETRNDSPSASRPVPISTSAPADYQVLGEDVEANWHDRNTPRDTPGSHESVSGLMNSPLRELSSSVSTVIWRGFEALRNTTGLQRRPAPDDIDRDR